MSVICVTLNVTHNVKLYTYINTLYYIFVICTWVNISFTVGFRSLFKPVKMNVKALETDIFLPEIQSQ